MESSTPAVAQTVYLDVALWINLARGIADSSRFQTAVQSATIIPALSFNHIFEFAGDPNPVSRKEVVQLIEGLQQMGQVRWIASLAEALFQEVRHSFEAWATNQNFRPVSLFAGTAQDVPGLNLSWNQKCRLGLSLESFVEAFSKSHGSYEALASHPMMDFPLLRNWAKRSAHFSQGNYTSDLILQLLDGANGQIQTAAGVHISLKDFSKDQMKEFADRFDFTNTPALSLLCAYFKGWSLTSGGDDPNTDLGDLFHLVGVAYCDVAFCDGRVHSALSKAHERLPKKNGDFPAWLEGLSLR